MNIKIILDFKTIVIIKPDQISPIIGIYSFPIFSGQICIKHILKKLITKSTSKYNYFHF